MRSSFGTLPPQRQRDTDNHFDLQSKTVMTFLTFRSKKLFTSLTSCFYKQIFLTEFRDLLRLETIFKGRTIQKEISYQDLSKMPGVRLAIWISNFLTKKRVSNVIRS